MTDPHHPRAARVSAGLFRVLETSADLIAVFGPDLAHVYCNDGVSRFTAMAREEILGKRYDELPMSRRNADAMQHAIERVFATGEPQRIEVRGHRRDTGAETVFDISYHPERGDDGAVALVIGISRDVSALRFAEERARAAADRLGILLDAVDMAIIGIDRERRIDFTNRVAERELRRLGAPAGELRGVPLADAFEGVGATLGHVDEVLATGRGRSFELLAGRDPRTRRFGVQLRAETAPDGAVLGVVVVARDLTLERRRQRQLRRSERLASLGRIAAGVAHEIANPLAAVHGNLDLARASLMRGAVGPKAVVDELLDMLGDAHQGSERIRQIIEEIGLLMRAGGQGEEHVDARELIERVVSNLGGSAGMGAQLTVDLTAVPEVAGSGHQLALVITNLLENAVLSMPPERPAQDNLIAIELRVEEGQVVLRLRDNGIGIQAEALEHVFDPFYTTRAVGHGMGLGLTVAHGIVASHEGTLLIESTPGQGTLVTMKLPIPAD